MNIIKFNYDIVEGKDWYNETLRGKYAWWIHCRFVIGFDENIDYINLEKLDNVDIISYLDSNNISYLDLDGTDSWAEAYKDNTATETANSILDFKVSNSFSPDVPIDPEDLKKFRTWLATSLLKKTWDEDDTHVLEYYADGMEDDVTKWLSKFKSIQISISGVPGSSSCGCVGGTGSNLSSLYSDGLAVCDSESIYRSNIKQLMIVLFSNLDTWLEKGWTVDFFDTIINYLKGILQENLPLVTYDSVWDTFSCKCLNDGGYAQGAARAVLEKLITVFTYIRNYINEEHEEGDTIENKNFIITTLTTWATELYERMEW